MAVGALQAGPIADGGLPPRSTSEVKPFELNFSSGHSGRIPTYSNSSHAMRDRKLHRVHPGPGWISGRPGNCLFGAVCGSVVDAGGADRVALNELYKTVLGGFERD